MMCLIWFWFWFWFWHWYWFGVFCLGKKWQMKLGGVGVIMRPSRMVDHQLWEDIGVLGALFCKHGAWWVVGGWWVDSVIVGLTWDLLAIWFTMSCVSTSFVCVFPTWPPLRFTHCDWDMEMNHSIWRILC